MSQKGPIEHRWEVVAQRHDMIFTDGYHAHSMLCILSGSLLGGISGYLWHRKLVADARLEVLRCALVGLCVCVVLGC